jgi:hypothetical protein
MLNKSFKIKRTTDDGKEFVFEVRPFGILVALVVGWLVLRKMKSSK